MNYRSPNDKKMLWRANLYIDEGSKDWNNLHPWIEGNEWNKIHDGKTIFKGLSNLDDGDGKQVIKIVPFTPFRTVDDSFKLNRVDNKVAYSYPKHDYEKSDGDSGSMDSPFDYNKKMLMQKELLQEDNTDWPSTTSPDRYWKKYSIETPGNDENTKAFVPGLGLFYYDISKGNTYNKENLTATEIANLKQSHIIEAGVDCTGFVQRVVEYSNPPFYKWRNLPEGMTEYSDNSGTDDIQDVIDTYDTNGEYRRYPYIDESSWEITKRNPLGLAPVNLNKIVPGDIFYYTDSTDGKTQGRHVAIVQDIEYSDNRNTEISSIWLIDSTFYEEDQHFVDKMKKIQRYNNDSKNWFIVRLENK